METDFSYGTEMAGLGQCCWESFPFDFDHVFTNLLSSTVSLSYPAAYTEPLSEKFDCQCSEEHKPVIGNITYQ